MSAINDFVKEKIKKEHQPIFIKFRAFINARFPFLKEEMRGGTEKYYGIPVYRNNRIILSVSPTQKGITFSFSEGKKFEDKFGLLEGMGKKTLNLRLNTPAEFNEGILEYYILQAIELDTK